VTVRVDRHDDGITVLTLDDPERRNAMTEEMGDALTAATAELAGDDDLRVVVLTGAPPAFSAGGDLAMLEELARRTRDEGFDATETMQAFYRRFLTVRDLPVPVIAAINGHAVGAGLCVALACDLRIVASDAKVGLNFARLGLHPGMGGSWLLPRTVDHNAPRHGSTPVGWSPAPRRPTPAWRSRPPRRGGPPDGTAPRRRDRQRVSRRRPPAQDHARRRPPPTSTRRWPGKRPPRRQLRDRGPPGGAPGRPRPPVPHLPGTLTSVTPRARPRRRGGARHRRRGGARAPVVVVRGAPGVGREAAHAGGGRAAPRPRRGAARPLHPASPTGRGQWTSVRDARAGAGGGDAACQGVGPRPSGR
jgi:hypothetical protein